MYALLGLLHEPALLHVLTSHPSMGICGATSHGWARCCSCELPVEVGAKRYQKGANRPVYTSISRRQCTNDKTSPSIPPHLL